MKMDWGWGIAIFYVVFVIALLLTVWKSTTYDHSLVEEDYYAKDLSYQEHYHKLLNASRLTTDLQISLHAENGIRLVFPTELGEPSGSIRFFKPSASNLDVEMKVDTDAAGEQIISTAHLKKGLWRIKVDWEIAGKFYFKEEALEL